MITFSALGRYGRIANQMFQIASTIGLAQKHGYSFGFPDWKNYDQLERFGGGEDINIQEWFKNPLPPMEEGGYKTHNIPWGFHELGVSDWSDLKGHMQSEKYFLNCTELIKYYFRFKHETEKRNNTIAVHYRGGDYGGSYHPTCEREYYANALQHFNDSDTLLLFTDDPDRAKNVIPFEYELIEGNHSMIDLELMSKCDGHIIANSTFSWWGAWLADSKKVVAPKIWFGPDAKLITEDIYPDKWLRV
jgi:hypothetical protein